MNQEGIDKKDHEILALIKDNARMTYSEIGEKVGLSRVAVKKRMDKMEQSSVIKSYKTIINETSGPSGITFFLDMELLPEKYQDVLDALAADQLIRQIYRTSGECRIHCVGTAPDTSTLDSHVNHLFKSTNGIRKVVWNILLGTIKDVDGGVEYERKQTGAVE